MELVVNERADVWLVLQTITFAGWFTWADGLTVMVNDFTGPWQLTLPFKKNGVTTIVATTGAEPVLIAVNALISPDPEAASPIPGVSLVHV